MPFFQKILTRVRQNRFLQITFIVYFCCLLLLGSRITIPEDVSLYKCYSIAFWGGTAKSSMTDRKICKHFGVNIPAKPFHQLPPEYPILALVSFLPTYFFPNNFVTAFSLEMLSVVVFIFYYLRKIASTRSAWIFIFLLFSGCLTIALKRYDLLPAAFILLCLHSALQKRFYRAYVFLAIATLLKFFPILLLFSLFSYEQASIKMAHRLKGIVIYFSLCSVVALISFLINFQGTLSPIRFFLTRSIEVESIQASILVLASYFHLAQFCALFRFGSLSLYPQIASSCSIHQTFLMQFISYIFLAIFFAALGWIYYLISNKKILLEQAFLSTLLVVLITGKILSPQYLIWVIPVIAYTYKNNLTWLFSWIAIAVLTLIIYPFTFLTKISSVLIVLRNLLLVLITLVYLRQITAKKLNRYLLKADKKKTRKIDRG